MNLRFLVFVIISLVAIFLYTLPNSTYSVLLQTHNVKDISSPSNDIPCTQCHSKIAAELSNSTYHSGMTCEDCHRNPYLGQTVAYDNGTWVSGGEAHAAVKPRCLDCHSKTSITLANGTTVSVPKANAFGDPNYGTDYSAHKKFVQDALNFSLGVGENEACLACHTDFKLNIEFVRPQYYNFTFQSWTSVVVNSLGPANTTVVFKGGSGAKHIWRPLSSINCTDCHADIWNAINHPEPSPNGLTPNSSHVIWYWGGRSNNPQAPIHDISKIGTAYANISDYCLSSCHNPQVSGTLPPELTDAVHVARRLSCYSCHTDSYSVSVFDKTSGGYVAAPWPPNIMGNLDVGIFNAPLILHADSCISCKRAGAPTPPTGPFVSYSEPNNLVYYNGGRV
ncbi:hypothetical protein [Geoglobus acetivorans]|uniref:Cytochrome c family protein n=1 Tax=Geoglobus acetivorans TaxID=565033 RepID=A0A0A7GFQ9_GEOAI|nr:cytochrome c family protein [Geoglobus acetivorans]